MKHIIFMIIGQPYPKAKVAIKKGVFFSSTMEIQLAHTKVDLCFAPLVIFFFRTLHCIKFESKSHFACSTEKSKKKELFSYGYSVPYLQEAFSPFPTLPHRQNLSSSSLQALPGFPWRILQII